MPDVLTLSHGVQPVESHEVVEAAAALLRAAEPFARHIGASEAARGRVRIHAHRLSLRDEDGDEAEGAPLWALVREMDTVGPRGRADRYAGDTPVRMQLQLSLDPDRIGASDPDGLLGYGHVLAWQALEGQRLDVADGSGRFASVDRVRRTDRPSPARLDPASGRLYSSAYYRAWVRPL